MLRLLSDENFHGPVVRALLARVPGLDLARVQDVGLMGVADPDVLAWAAQEGRILLSHDKKTIPRFAAARITAGEPMPGVFMVPLTMPTGQAIDELELLATATAMDEWSDVVKFLPL